MNECFCHENQLKMAVNNLQNFLPLSLIQLQILHANPKLVTDQYEIEAYSRLVI